jgi:UDP-N-acetylenolpyruvoylglucosamine reductase
VLLGDELEALVDGECALEALAKLLDAVREQAGLAIELAGVPGTVGSCPCRNDR